MRFTETWAGDELPSRGADIVRRFQCSAPMHKVPSSLNYTILIKLNHTEEELWGHLKRTTRYEIRRARSTDRLSCKMLGASESKLALPDFRRFFFDAAKQKPQPPLNVAWLRAIARFGQLRLTRVMDENSTTLAWHAYHLGPQRATLLNSASAYRSPRSATSRQMVGRANRLLHWWDMLRFKESGVPVYDLGGWYSGQLDDARLRINYFKEQFGGEVTKQFTCERPVSLRGVLFLAIRDRLIF